jgi:hypothetical protein
MFTCSTCKNEWPENYCPVCARTIVNAPVLEKSNSPRPQTSATKPDTTLQKASKLRRCLWWFVVLFTLNILTFWIAIFLGDTYPSMGWVVGVGLATVGPLAIFTIYKIYKITNSSKGLILYSLFVLLPPTATVALILLCGRTLTEAARLGYRITLLTPRLRAGLFCGMIIITGFWIACAQVYDFQNHLRLKKSGKNTTGTLQMVTRHYVNFMPSGYTFTVDYSGRTRNFEVNETIYLENTLPSGKFIRHEIPMIYLPDQPDVAELPGMMGFSMFSLLLFLVGGILVCSGGWGLYRAIIGIKK